MFNQAAFIKLCREKLADYYNESHDAKITDQDTSVVWFSKTLQNAKAILITNAIEDRSVYEFSLNGDKNELYFDAYTKRENRLIKLD